MIYAFSDCTLDLELFELRRAGVTRPLEPQVFDLLRYLIENRERVVTKEDLFEAIWKGRIVSDSTLSSRIKAARQAIGDSGSVQALIQTLHGRGFRFVGTVTAAKPDLVPADGDLKAAFSPPADARAVNVVPLMPAARMPAERKQITVLVARIVWRDGSIVASDPEVALERIDPAICAATETVTRHGGVPTLLSGDALTALFGAPVAHEHHVMRACMTAIAIRDAVSARSGGLLSARIGLHSGEVVFRTVVDGGATRPDAVGPALVIAARLAERAALGEIQLSTETGQLADGFLETRPAEPLHLGAGTEPIGVVTLGGIVRGRTRWAVRAARGLTRLVGREAELERLQRALAKVRASHGQVVAIVGEPGVGKSRLVHEFVRSEQAQGCGVAAADVSAHDLDAAYDTVAKLLRAWFEVGEGDTQAEIISKVRSALAVLAKPARSAESVLRALLDLPVEDGEWAILGAAQRRRRTVDCIKTLVFQRSLAQPLILVIEDLHWIDAQTQEVLDALVESLAQVPVFLIVTYRPEYRHSWAAKSYFDAIRLDPLSDDHAHALLSALLGDDPDLERLRRTLIERTQGRPLFVEETVRALAETGVLEGERGRYRLLHPDADAQVPSTVQAVLAARIDRLSPDAKSLLQMAAVIGKDVPVSLLGMVADRDEEALYRALDELQSAELLYEAALPANTEYSFKHVLIRDVAYQGLLRERRRTVHVNLVRAMERRYAGRLDEQIERLAYHSLAGELWAEAAVHLLNAARRAIERSAHLHAADFLARGLESLTKLPKTEWRLRQELEYRKAMGVTMMAAKGWGAPEVADAYEHALALCEHLGDERELFTVLRGQGQFHMIRGEMRVARELGHRCLALARASSNPGVQVETHHLFWSNSFFLGDYAEAQLHSDRGIAMYQRKRDHGLTYVYSGHDPGVCCRCFSGLIDWQRGQPDRAVVRSNEALALAEEVHHPLTLALAYWGLSYVHLLRREPELARHWAEKEIAVCSEYMLPLLLSQGLFQLGWALTASGQLEEGLEKMDEGVAAIRRTGAEMGLPYLLALRAEAHASQGDVAKGLTEIDGALATAKERGAGFNLPEILRLKGELLLIQPSRDVTAASACFEEAIAVARTQGARLPELRATTSLVRRLRRGRARAAGNARLAKLRAAFTEGLDTMDLVEATALT
jgi:DNA-binding winged helix-turn-helix (wHTH) protein/predicted ATPase